MKILLAGNQNCGKTALFNRLTGSERRVGNFPGVTVEMAKGRLCKSTAELIDLPGIYSFPAYTPEEEISERYLRGGCDCIINVLDATNLERNLYLTLQLSSLKIPMVLAINMSDELANGGGLDARRLSGLLGIEVFEVSALKNRGIEELASGALRTASDRKLPSISDPGKNSDDYENAARVRYELIARLLAASEYIRPHRLAFTTRADTLLAGRKSGIPMLLLIMAGIFYISFALVGANSASFFSGTTERISAVLKDYLLSSGVEIFLVRLLTEGALTGVSAVLGFLPTVITLFIFMSILEDSGYMARAAYLLDSPFRRLGLSGRSFVPMLMGFGCSVPAMLAARTLPDERTRRATVMLTPYASCSAKIAVYGFISQSFFSGHELSVTALLYIIGLVSGCAAAIFLKHGKKGEPGFLLELPVYRKPSALNVLRHVRQRSGDFLVRAFSVILISSVVIWLLQSVDFSLRLVSPGKSILASFGQLAARIFAPLGFGNWKAVTALFCGFAAKENIVGVLRVLTGGAGLGTLFDNGAAAFSFLTFVLLYTPCVAAVSASARELGGRGAVKMIFMQTVIAYTVSLLVFNAARLIM